MSPTQPKDGSGGEVGETAMSATRRDAGRDPGEVGETAISATRRDAGRDPGEAGETSMSATRRDPGGREDLAAKLWVILRRIQGLPMELSRTAVSQEILDMSAMRLVTTTEVRDWPYTPRLYGVFLRLVENLRTPLLSFQDPTFARWKMGGHMKIYGSRFARKGKGGLLPEPKRDSGEKEIDSKRLCDSEETVRKLMETLEEKEKQIELLEQKLINVEEELAAKDQFLEEVMDCKRSVIEFLEERLLAAEHDLEVATRESVHQFEVLHLSGMVDLERRRKMSQEIANLRMALKSAQNKLREVSEQLNYTIDDLNIDIDSLETRNQELMEDSWAHSFEHCVVVSFYTEAYRQLTFLLNRYRELKGKFQKEIDAVNSWDGANL